MSSRPPRKFAPVPVEETTKSSRKPAAAAEEPAKPRRFIPEPVEHTTKSSKHIAPQVAETEKAKPRRFAPEPVEHSVKSSKAGGNDATEADPKPKPRRFAPQLVDESEKSSKSKPAAENKQHVKFKPDPIATTYGGNRKAKRQFNASAPSEPSLPDSELEENPPPRKFSPILLDTATRSRRAGEANAPLPQDYRTEYGYHAHPREHWRRLNGETTPLTASEREPAGDAANIDEPSSNSEASSARLRAPCLPDGTRPSRSSLIKPQRTHSFRAPELETIDSSESDGDDLDSTPRTPDRDGSPLTVSDSYELFKHATRRRESIEDSWQHYLLDLERKKAQERLEEQALAAFPNADFGYEHPHHYFNLDDDSGEFEIEDRPVTWDGNDDDFLEMARRESTVNMLWEKGEMHRHAEVLQQERNAIRVTAKQPTQPAWQKPGTLPDAEVPDPEMKSMRDRARPPMLGDDLVFVRCASPEPARFDVTQGAAVLKNQMCYLTATADAEHKRTGDERGLWQSPGGDGNRDSAIQTPVSPTPSSKGLWGGFCVDDGENGMGFSGVATPSGISGLKTPRHEHGNPFHSSAPTGGPNGSKTPKTPTKNKSRTDLQRLNAILVTEREIDPMMEREYPDSFITQVYNYLSLGYPSLARPFDDELSKVSRIPIPELRQDDQKARSTARGFIRLGADFEGGGGEGLVEENCMRWRALKRYVREWAKQEKNWAPSDGVGANLGVGARRGSWGI